MKKVMYRPLDYWQINQHFAENKACVPLNGGAVITCDGKNPPEGYRSLYGENGHGGIDLGANAWTPVYACQRGTVQSLDTNLKSGYDVRIWSEEFGFLHIYEHLNKWNVTVGDKVETGQVIGWVGSTGFSSGPHLHFECRDKDGVAFDPLPLMEDIKASEIYKINNTLKGVTQSVSVLAEQIRNYIARKVV